MQCRTLKHCKPLSPALSLLPLLLKYVCRYKITLKRSSIGLPKRAAQTIKALGLNKSTGSITHQPVTPTVAGKILTVKELVRVELTDSEARAKADQLAKERKRREVGWVAVD